MKNCENCGNEHDGTYGSGRFCSVKCSRGFSTKAKRKEINEKVSKTLTGRTLSDELKNKLSRNNARYWKGKKRPGLNTKRSFNSADYKGVKVIKKCKHCKNEKLILKFGNICNECKGDYRLYRELCNFKFSLNEYPNLFDLDKLNDHGFYSPTNAKNPNLNGVSRDHKISVKYGFENNIPPYIISHPLNCELLIHSENQIKYTKCSVDVDELIEMILKYE